MVPPWVELRSACYRDGGLYEGLIGFSFTPAFRSQPSFPKRAPLCTVLWAVSHASGKWCGQRSPGRSPERRFFSFVEATSRFLGSCEKLCLVSLSFGM